MLAQLAIVLLAAGLPLGGFGEPLQPATYQSPSGAWCLVVDPTDRYGEGAADFRVSKSGDPIWSKRLPFTWRHACIDDRGFAAGSGYGLAADGLTPGGSIVIAVVSPAGEIASRRDWPIGNGAQVIGTMTGLVADPENGDVLFRISTAIPTSWGQSFEQWCIVDLDRPTFEIVRPEERVDAPASLHADLVDVIAVPGTDLLAVSWNVTDVSESPQISDLSLTIMKRNGQRVAALEVPNGFEGDVSWSKVREHGTLQRGASDATFSLWVPGRRVRVEFGLKPLSDAEWLIEELGQQAYEPADATPRAVPPSEAFEPKLLERVALQAQASPDPGPIRDIEAFAVAGPGQLQVLRVDDRQRSRFTCLLLDEQGNVLSQNQLPLSESEHFGVNDWHALGGGRWLISPRTTWCVDAILADSSGNLQRGMSQGFLNVEAAQATSDGGYVILGHHLEVSGYLTDSGGMALASYDASGSRRWLTSLEGKPGDAFRLTTADDVAITPTGVVAAIDPWEDAICLFDHDGSFVARLELSQLWQRDPTYVAHIEADGSEGFLVVDNPSEPIVHRIGLDGRIRSSLVPRYPDGAKHDLLPANVQRAPDGRLWTSDRQVLLRLGEDGVADRVLGQTKLPENLDDPRGCTIDPRGRVLLFDASTRSVHAFDRSGAPLFVAVPLPEDFAGDYSEGDVVGSFDGRSFVSTEAFEGWLSFDASGKRIGAIDLGGRSEVAGLDYVAFTPAGPFWRHRTQDREFVFLLDEEGNELAHVDRRADRHWFEDVASLAAAPSGHVAVLEQLEYSGGAAVSWYDAQGKPLGQHELPAWNPGDTIAFSGEWIAVHSYKSQAIWLVQTAQARLMRMVPPPGWIAAIGFSPDGRELWLVQPADRALLRFSLP